MCNGCWVSTVCQVLCSHWRLVVMRPTQGPGGIHILLGKHKDWTVTQTVSLQTVESARLWGKKQGERKVSSWGSRCQGQEGEVVWGEDWVLSPGKWMQHLEDKGRWFQTKRGLEAKKLWYSWVYYPKQSIDSMQSPSSYQQYFSEN